MSLIDRTQGPYWGLVTLCREYGYPAVVILTQTEWRELREYITPVNLHYDDQEGWWFLLHPIQQDTTVRAAVDENFPPSRVYPEPRIKRQIVSALRLDLTGETAVMTPCVRFQETMAEMAQGTNEITTKTNPFAKVFDKSTDSEEKQFLQEWKKRGIAIDPLPLGTRIRIDVPIVRPRISDTGVPSNKFFDSGEMKGEIINYSQFGNTLYYQCRFESGEDMPIPVQTPMTVF